SRRASALVEYFFGDQRRRHGGGPTRVERKMGDELDDLVLGNPIVERALEMAAELLAAIEGDEGRDSDQAAIALGETGPLPDIAEQDFLGEIDQLRRDRANLVASGGRGRGCGHVSFLLTGLSSRHIAAA